MILLLFGDASALRDLFYPPGRAGRHVSLLSTSVGVMLAIDHARSEAEMGHDLLE